MALFYILYHFFLQRLTFFSFNRFYLLSSLVMSFLIPALQLEIERKAEVQPRPHFSEVLTSSGLMLSKDSPVVIPSDMTVTIETSYTWLDGINAVYWLVAAVSIGSVIIQSLLVLKHTAKINMRLGNLNVIYKSKGFTNCSFLNYVFVDAEHLTEEQQGVILKHEQVHADQMHTLDKLFVQFCKSLLWFNPFIYLYGQALESVHEYEADKDASCTVGQSNYANLLLAIAVRKNNSSLLQNFVKHPLKARIHMLFTNPSKNMKKLTYLISLPMLAMLLWGFSVSYVDKENLPNVKEAIPFAEKSIAAIDSPRYRQKVKLNPELLKLQGGLAKWRESEEYKKRLAKAYRLGHGVISGVVKDNPQTDLDKYTPYLFITDQQTYVFDAMGMDQQTIARVKSMGRIELKVGTAGVNQYEPYLSISASKIMKDSQVVYARPVPVQSAFLYEANKVRFTDGTITKIGGSAYAREIEVAANGHTFLVKANSAQVSLKEFEHFKRGDQVRLRFVHELKSGQKSYLIKDWVAISKDLRSYGLKNKQMFYRFYEKITEKKLANTEIRYSATDSIVVPRDNKTVALYGAVTFEFQDIKIEGTQAVYNKESMLGSARQVTVRDEVSKTLIKADSVVFNAKNKNMKFFGVKAH